MKKLIFVILAIVAAINSKGQSNYINVCQDCDNNWWQNFDFNSEDDNSAYYFYFDTTQANNIWQIGTPNKTIFNYGYYYPRALVTDTVNAYPINNISSFQFSILNCSGQDVGDNCNGGYGGPNYYIVHKIETDNGFDGGTIEVSHNNGISWVNLIQDTMNFVQIGGNIYTLNDTVASLGKPGFSGSAEWDEISIYYQISPINLDTITFRFTFASDAIETNQDGWMIGFISVGGIFEGIDEIRNDNLITIDPNPASDKLLLHRTKNSPNQTVQIMNNSGQVLYNNTSFFPETIDAKQFTNGMYVLKYSDGKNFAIKRFIVQH
ncbi:MAG: T9SS type A sorting domain-containing protein [Bacteroidales bacterium]|nr:T9SS type A sorting domain-containing protein [Bacteroidales bacterium]